MASIKAAKPGTRGYSVVPQPGRLVATNATLKILIAEAYHVFEFQISGGPAWVDGARYDIEGKAPEGERPTNAQYRVMLQKLLAERFRLSLHRATRDLPVYLLEIAKGGPKFRMSPDPNGEPYFRLFQRRQITAQRAPVAWLVETLSPLLGRQVLDKTGLDGVYDFKLEWTPDEFQAASDENAAPAGTGVPPISASLQDQLGLRLRGQRAPVEILVIESAEKPDAN